jgi:hypothetical protein
MEIKTTSGHAYLAGYPNKCPFCHHAINPDIIVGHENNQLLEVFMICPNNKCKRSFIAYYDVGFAERWEYSGKSSKGNIQDKRFSDNITSTSPLFSVIYNQSFAAEQNELLEICGVGYRKALEFLIKDYSIFYHPDDKDKIKKMPLSQCIEQYTTDARVKLVAKRAVWLGNDETHYIRKWEEKSLQDLKILISLAIHWIEMEALTKTTETDMPE